MVGVQLELFRPRSIVFGVADDLDAVGIDVAVVGVVAVVVVFVAVVFVVVVVFVVAVVVVEAAVVAAENDYWEDKHPFVQKMDWFLAFAEVLHVLFQWHERIEL